MFTEIAVEAADDKAALCRATTQGGAHVALRVLDDGRATGRFAGLVSYSGPRSGAHALLQDLAQGRTHVEVVSETEGHSLLRISCPTDGEGAPRVMAVGRLLQQLGPETMLEPMVFRQGRLRARILSPRRLEPQVVLAALADAQKACGFREFRVLRVSHVEPHRVVDAMRPLLQPEQDALLRLAVEMGYYDNPKRATLEEIAARVGLSISPVHKRLKAAEEALVAAHVSPTGRHVARRRARRVALAGGPLAPSDVDLVVRAPRHPLARFAAGHRPARVLLQPVQEETGGNALSHVLVVGPSGTPTDCLAALRGSGAALEEVMRDETSAFARVRGRTDDGWSLSALSTAFVGDAWVRAVVFEGDDAFVRLALTRPFAADDILSRVQKAVPHLGWEAAEVVSIAPADAARGPSDLPQPLSARQEEVLKVAHALGYYRTPRSCKLENVAATLGVSANAIHKNLVGAEAKIILRYLGAAF